MSVLFVVPLVLAVALRQDDPVPAQVPPVPPATRPVDAGAPAPKAQDPPASGAEGAPAPRSEDGPQADALDLPGADTTSTAADVREPVVGREEHQFVTFGRDVLRRARVIASGEAESVVNLANGVSVARFRLAEVLRGDPRLESLVVLAAPGDFGAGGKYMLFLQPFGDAAHGSGDAIHAALEARNGRYTWVGRFSAAERDYDSKVKVLRQYLDVLATADPVDRALALRDRLVANVGSDDLFVKWNAVRELRAFAERQRAAFGRKERARLVEVLRKESSPSFRSELEAVLEILGVRRPEERRG